ncbi:hypothetical protein C5O22_11170 [Treponema sp. J25]|nr:hypothetical protein C5O22_11170 [Treponema sp. J25]
MTEYPSIYFSPADSAMGSLGAPPFPSKGATHLSTSFCSFFPSGFDFLYLSKLFSLGILIFPL